MRLAALPARRTVWTEDFQTWSRIHNNRKTPDQAQEPVLLEHAFDDALSSGPPIGAEQGRNLALAGLEYIERALECRVFIIGVLEFDHGQRKAVHETSCIGPMSVPTLDCREPVHRQPVVRVNSLPLPAEPSHSTASTEI